VLSKIVGSGVLGTFSPDQLGSLVYWFDPNEGTTLSGGDVSQWDSRVGDHYLASSIGLPSLISGAIGGNAILDFSPSELLLWVSANPIDVLAGAAGLTAYLVVDDYVQQGAGSLDNQFIGLALNTPKVFFMLNVRGDTGRLALNARSQGADSLQRAYSTETFSTSGGAALVGASASYAGGSGEFHGDFSGTSALTFGSNTLTGSSDTGSTLGYGVTGTLWQGHIGDVLIFNEVLSIADRAKVESYLRDKWGL
jgi:hypothetical protein